MSLNVMKLCMLKDKIFIVGPCSAESEEQVAKTAAMLPAGIIFRAGVWKPRTSPASFQGAGTEALEWLRNVGHPSATEVATPEHVSLALAAGIHYLWIGARTSANPIAVQAIADSIRCVSDAGVDPTTITVLIKNPVNEDVALWLGNVERLEKTNVRVMAIHRGCAHRPCWQMAFEFRRQRPDIPLLLDPSHLSGDSRKVESLCCEAMRLAFDGLMVEVHPEPAKALSDAKQQITPEQFCRILEKIESDMEAKAEDLTLSELRKEIDEVDDELWRIIAKRMDVSRRIGAYKKEHQLDIVQPKRYEEILRNRIEWACAKHGISEDAVRRIMADIHEESVRVQL